MKKKSPKMSEKEVIYWPSHEPFTRLIEYCVRGRSHPILKSRVVDDHSGDLCLLVMDDTEDFLLVKDAPREGKAVTTILHELGLRVHTCEDMEAAKMLYAIAVEAADEVLSLYLRHRQLFDKITPYRKTLPCLHSIHPDTPQINRRMIADARLGSKTEHARQVGSKPYFVSDTPANIYARAIITSIEMNRHLDPVEKQQKSWASFNRKEAFRTVVLPFPKYVGGIETIPVPISPENVLQYWRKGKEIILEELPQFDERPEWEQYRRRKYKDGGKPGAIRHAIFKDILIALKTIAGMNKGKTAEPSTIAASQP